MVQLKAELRLNASPPMTVCRSRQCSSRLLTRGFVGSRWGSPSPATAAPPLPPRQPANSEAFSASQWMNHFASKEALWQLPGPPVTNSTASPTTNAVYDPNMYGPMSGDRPPSYNPEDSAWEHSIGHGQSQTNAQMMKPPLPVSGHRSLSHSFFLIFWYGVLNLVCLH